MKLEIKILLVVLFFFWGIAGVHAQNKHEFSVTGGGGFSGLNYKVSTGENKSGLGGNFGLRYNYFLSQKWGIGTGAEFAFYNSKYELDSHNFSSIAKDRDGNYFEFRSSIRGYNEKQRAMMLQIPLMLQFQTSGKYKFYLAAGGKLGFPLKGKFNNTTSSLTNSGFYAHENSLYDTQEFMGFGTFTDKKYDGEIKFNTIFFASIEAGVKIRLNEKLSLYSGAYLDYGLNNIIKTTDFHHYFVEYYTTGTPPFVVNSVLNSVYSQGIGKAPQVFSDKATPMAIGFRLRLAFGL